MSRKSKGRRYDPADLAPIRPGDQRLANEARSRPFNGYGQADRPDTRTAVCRDCGRTWEADSVSFDGNGGRVMGFLASAANNHCNLCKDATPEQRRAIARLDMRRWSRLRADPHAMKMQQRVIINFRHEGFGNEPIFDDPALEERFGASI